MNKPLDYDRAQAATYGDAGQQEPVSPGGHGVEILKAETGKDSYGDYLLLSFDIKEGSEYDDFFRKKYSRQLDFARTQTEKKYGDPTWQGTFRQYIYEKDGTTNKFFKGLITSIEKSNPPYKFNWDESTLKKKRLGLVFREEEFIGRNDQQKHTTVRAAWACDWDSFPDMPVPAIKKLKEKPLSSFYGPDEQNLVPAPEEKLPWD